MQEYFYASSYAAKSIFAARQLFHASVRTDKIVTMKTLKLCEYTFNDSSYFDRKGFIHALLYIFKNRVVLLFVL